MFGNNKMQYKYLTIFAVIFVVFYMMQSVLINRLVDLHGISITGGTFIYFLTPMILAILAEVYGFRAARHVFWLELAAVIFLWICIKLVNNAPEPAFWTNIDNAYATALQVKNRVLILSLVATLVGQFIIMFMVSKSKIAFKAKYFYLRSVVACLIGDGISVTLAIVVIYVGQMTMTELLHMLLPELAIMVIFTIVGGIPATIIAKLVERKTDESHYDIGIRYNPFGMSLVK